MSILRTPRNPGTFVFLPVSLSAALLTPLTTFLLLWMKGFPNFADEHKTYILLWCFETTGPTGLLSGLLLAALFWVIRPRWGWLIWPYDFGRSVSVGAVGGAAAHVLGMLVYRFAIGKPFSTFWMSGAILSGAICGAIIAAVYFWRRSNDPIVP